MAILFHPDGAVEDKRGGALYTAMQALRELSLSQRADCADGVSNPTTLSRFDMPIGTPYALPAYHAPYQEALYVPSVSDGRRRVCDSPL